MKKKNELRNKINKLKELKIQKPSIIDNIIKSDKTWSTLPPKIIQDVRKRDDKVRTFALPNNDDEMEKLEKETLAVSNLSKLGNLKKSDYLDPNFLKKIEFDKRKNPKNFEMEKNLENINLNSVNNLIKEIEENITEDDNIVDLGDGKEVYFRDLFNFLHDINDGNIKRAIWKKAYED